MQRLQAYKYELMPDGEQQRDMRRFAGSCRFVYNKALALQKENHEAGNKFIGYVAMAKMLTVWRNSAETAWLSDAPVHPLQQSLKDVDRAYTNFFAKRADFPRFKRKNGGRNSFRYPDPKQIKLEQGNNRIFLPKLGWLRYRNSREVLGEVRNVTVSARGGKWFISIQTQREVGQPVPVATSAIGIDVGIARFATLSDGSFIAPLNSFKKHQQRLARYQRRMSRKTKFSSNWAKAKVKVQKIHTGIANARRDFLHKCSTTISKNHALVCIEDLQIRNMSKSSKGTTTAPGKMVKQKSGLNRAILDQGWGDFGRQLGYKLAWEGGMLLAPPPQYSSQECPACGHVSKDNRLTQATFVCVVCGYENHADVVGAINILERGYRLLACGELAHSGHSVKQEPTEATQAFCLSAVGIAALQVGEDVNDSLNFEPQYHQQIKEGELKGYWKAIDLPISSWNPKVSVMYGTLTEATEIKCAGGRVVDYFKDRIFINPKGDWDLERSDHLLAISKRAGRAERADDVTLLGRQRPDFSGGDEPGLSLPVRWV